MKKPQLENWQKAGIILGVVLTITLIVNTSLMAYVTYQNSFKASIFPTSDTGESLDIDIHGIIGRPSPLRYYLNNIKDWVSAWAVGGVEKTNAETGILVAIDGSNIASTASVDYYIEAIPQSGGSAYRFLEGNSSSVTVNGADLDLSNQTTIENHLTAMGLSTDASHTIDYYVYVKAEATGAISGDTLTSEITKTLFDTVNYQWGSETTGDIDPVSTSTVKEATPTTATPNEAWPTVRTGGGETQYWLFQYDLTDVAAISALTWYVRCDVMTYTSNSDWMLHSIGSFDSSTTWDTKPGTISTLESVSTDIDFGWHDFSDSRMLSYLQSKEGSQAYWQFSKSADVNRRGFYGWGSSVPYIHITYVGFSASWYPIGPVSVLSMPLGQTLGAFTVIALAAYTVYQTLRKEKK